MFSKEYNFSKMHLCFSKEYLIFSKCYTPFLNNMPFKEDASFLYNTYYLKVLSHILLINMSTIFFKIFLTSFIFSQNLAVLKGTNNNEVIIILNLIFEIFLIHYNLTIWFSFMQNIFFQKCVSHFPLLYY